MVSYTSYTENELSEIIIGLCIEVHRELGPGLLESVYEAALAYELDEYGLRYLRQQSIPVIYKGRKIESGFRADFIVENKVLLELKSLEKLTNFDKKKTRNHLILTGLKLGLLLNFNVPLLKDGIVRIVNNL